jgi:HEAT repeat protein
MTRSSRSGKIITFYSYKGGTGRTMALANLAWVLASNEQKVLIIDWDLEAPGLHQYLRPFLIDPELQHSRGLIDFVWDLSAEKMTPAQDFLPNGEGNHLTLEDYVIGLDWNFIGEGSIAFVPAGRQDEDYAHRVNTFDWDNFYERLGGGKLLHATRDALRQDYDYILIDSRTGVSDTSGICTVQMPDLLVMCFTLNHQSVRGAAAVAASVQRQRGSNFRIYPVPTRLEDAETAKLDTAMAFAKRMFAPFLTNVQGNSKSINLREQEKYWLDVRTPYKTFYAFEEVPASFKDPPGSHDTILASTERLSGWITNGKVSALRPVEEAQRQTVIAAYAFTTLELPELGATRDAFVTGTPDSTEIAALLISSLQQMGLSIDNVGFEELGEVRDGWPASVEQSRNGIFVFGTDQMSILETYLRRFVQQSLDAESDRVAIPVIMGRNALPRLPTILRNWQISIAGHDAIPDAVARIRAILLRESEVDSGQGDEAPTGSTEFPPGFHIAIESLASADLITRQAGARALSRMGTREADGKLIQYIDDEDETIRGLAFEAAGRTDIGTERFLAELEGVDVERRLRAATVLGARGEARAFSGLVRLLNDSAGKVRAVGASALAKLANPIALDWLLPRLSDPESEVRRAVASSVIQMATRFDANTLSQLSAAIRQVLTSASGQEATEALLNGLNNANLQVRYAVEGALGSVSRPEIAATLIKALDHTDPQVRSTAVRVLGAIRRPEATEALIRALEDDDRQVRIAVAQTLRSMSRPEAMEALIRRLYDAEPQVRIAVAQALRSMSRPEATEALITRLDDAEPQLRIAIVQALGSVNRPEATEALINALDDADPQIRVASAEALGSVSGPEATEARTSALNELMDGSLPEIIRTTALAARARSFKSLQQRLLTRDFNGLPPWLDPSTAIDQSRVASAAEKLEIPEAEVKANYEEINRLLNNRLTFNWGQVTGAAAPPQATEPAHTQSLIDAVLRAVQKHPEGATAKDVLSYLAREFGMTIRPNHLGISLQRHRRAGRLENRDQKWWYLVP